MSFHLSTSFTIKKRATYGANRSPTEHGSIVFTLVRCPVFRLAAFPDLPDRESPPLSIALDHALDTLRGAQYLAGHHPFERCAANATFGAGTV